MPITIPGRRAEAVQSRDETQGKPSKSRDIVAVRPQSRIRSCRSVPAARPAYRPVRSRLFSPLPQQVYRFAAGKMYRQRSEVSATRKNAATPKK
ncbi:hypothetical protein F6P96_09900 [Escherichia coli]|nr:hypothetical protein F6P96_09900 [Escherichia coli]